MALRESGCSLIAKGYQAYMAALNKINQMHKVAFDDRRVKQFNAAQQQTTRSSKDWARVVSRASSEGKRFSSSIGGLSEGMGRFATVTAGASGASGGLMNALTSLTGAAGGAAGAAGLGGVVSSLAAIAGPAALAAAGIGLVVVGLKQVHDIAMKAIAAFTSFMKVSGQVAAENEMLGVLLYQVGKGAGYTEEQIASAEAGLRKQGITIEQSRRALTTLAKANIEWSEATKLGRLAQDTATHALIDSSEAYGRLIYGMQTSNRLILRRLGLVVNWEKAQRALAKEIGVNVDELTEFDLAQARVNALMEAGTRIVGSYEAAMKTVAKQQGSMVRLVKDAQDAWGKLVLPIMETSVELKSTFWVALRDTGEALGFLADALDKGRDLLSDYASKVAGAAEEWLQAEGYLREGQTIIEGIAERLFEASKEIVRFGVGLVSAGQIVVDVGHVVIDFAKLATSSMKWVGKAVHWAANTFLTIGKAALWVAEQILKVSAASRAWQEDITFEEAMAGFDEAMVQMSLSGDMFAQRFEENMTKAVEMFPWLMMTYDEAMATLEVSLDRGTDKINEQIRAFQRQKRALEASMEATAAMESIMLKYERALTAAGEKRAAALAALSEDAAEKEEKNTEDLHKKLAKIEADAAERAAKLHAQQTQKIEKMELDRQRKLQQNYEKYLLRKQQSQRRFQLTERRLAAAGDILGLIMAREDEQLRLKEEEENRQLGLRHDQQNYDARLADAKKAFDEQMVLLAQEVEKQRQAAIDAATQQRLDLHASQVDQRQMIEDNYAKQLQMAEQAKDDALHMLGRKIQAEGKMNEEGAQEWVDLMNELYGVDGFADAFYTGYTERAESVLTIFHDKQKAQLAEIMELMAYIEEFREMPPVAPPAPRPGGRRPRYRRMGGEDIVTGPATFVVEPGVTEYHSFVPLPVSQAINVKHSGRFELGGAQNASPGVVDLALERMVDSFDLALRKLRRR